MILLLLRLPLVLAIALPMAWALVLGTAAGPDQVLSRGLLELAKAYPAGPVREEMVDTARGVGERLRLQVGVLGPSKAELVGAGIMITGLHLGSTVRLLPFAGMLVLAGVVAGLLSRERIRGAQGYASPTASGLARLAVGTGLAWILLYSLSPIPAGEGWLYLGAGGTAVGSAVYTGNLPLKL